MKVARTAIADVLLLEPKLFGDERGFFVEPYNRRSFREATGLELEFVQDNQSRSKRGVLRGLHYQIRQPQGKLIRVLAGRIFDVAVDLRRHSPSFGQWVGLELDAQSVRMLWIPPGFAHGFCVLSETADVEYKCSDVYDAEGQLSILWNDPEIGVKWPIADPILSPKDAAAPRLREVEGRLT